MSPQKPTKKSAKSAAGTATKKSAKGATGTATKKSAKSAAGTAAKKSAKSAAGSATKKSAKESVKRTGATKGFTDDEKAAMKERARELKAESRRGKRGKKAGGEADLVAKIAEMQGPDQAMAKRLHTIVTAAAPNLSPKTWYGMPAYAKDGKVVCFFQSAQKFKARYATFGFSDEANLDDGAMWPTSFALKRLGAAEERKIADLVKQAVR
jgi:uncharacterized protein YdhG (YjbR/CyaY superfamily)